jgi:hypothetical protein
VARSTFGENIGSDQLLTLAQSLGSVDPRAVTFVTVPTTGIANDRGNEVLRPGEERALFSAIIGEQPLPGTPGAVPAPVPGAPPAANVRLVDARSPGASQDDGDHDDGDDHDGEHHDGGDHDGDDREGLRAPAELAGPSTATVAERLRADGFRVVTDDSGSPSTGVSGTTIRYSPDQAAAAQALSSAVPGATLDPGASGRGTLTLVLGDDFDGQVRSAAAPEGATPSTPVNPTITAADASCT